MRKKVLNRTPDGVLYFGSQPDRDGSLSGTGLKRERDGTYFVGEWKDNLRDGYGAFFGMDGQVIISQWEQDRAEGPCVCVYAPDSPYALFQGTLEEGDFKEGTAVFTDGRLYHGIFSEWRGTEFNGEGALLFRDGRIYAGHWKNGGTDVGGVIRRKTGQMTGALMNTRPSYEVKSWPQDPEKRFFYGQTSDEEIRNAAGILFYTNGGYFIGTFRGGLKSGSGTIQDEDGTIRIGEWKNDHQHGRGIAFRKSAAGPQLFWGEFSRDQYDGEGTLMEFRDGHWTLLYSGTWRDGRYSGVGLLDLRDGKYYLGTFRDGLPDGEGQTIDRDGFRTVSRWKMGAPSIDLKTVYEPGPERQLYDAGKKVPVVVFNSLMQGGVFGEQKFFVGIRSEEETDYSRSVLLEPGFEYEVRVAYCNNATPSFPTVDSSAKGVKLRVFFSDTVGPSKKAVVSASISAENAKPAVIWDSVILQADEEIPISYKIASAKIWNLRRSNGKILPQTLFTDVGVRLGGDELDGEVQAGEGFAGYVTFTLKAGGACRREKHPSLERQNVIPNISAEEVPVQKTGKRKRSRVSIKIVSPVNETDCTKEIHATLGEEIPLKVLFTNSASSQDLHIRITLPSSLEYVANSAVMTGTGLSRYCLNDGWIHEGAFIGNFAGDGEGEISFKTRYFPSLEGGADDSKIKVEIETHVITMQNEASITERAE